MLLTKKTLCLIIVINFLSLRVATKNRTEKWGKNYNFIIVGGGTAGATLASRLSEIKKWKILLLEAGDQPSLLSKIPALATSLQDSPLNWQYISESQNDTFRGMNNHTIPLPSGKVLGGSSAINYMIYERGNPEDYDNWEKMGNQGWSFKDILPYFLKSEKSNLQHVDAEYHNKLGIMNIEDAYLSEKGTSFLQAMKELGYNTTDYNGQNQIGFSTLQATLKDGQRQTTVNAFLEPILNRTNLEVVLLAEVSKILIDSSGERAKAVRFTKNNKTYRAFASNEIILSAGVFNSPKLLMLSGIGPKHVLKKLRIHPIIKDLPVGESLKDHVTYPALNFITNSNQTQLEKLKDYLINVPFWYIAGKGMLSSLGNFEAVGFVQISTSKTSQTRPNVELLFLNSGVNLLLKKVTNIKNNVYAKLYNNTNGKIMWSIYPTLLHTKSKGQILLKSKRPSDPPLLYPKYFSNEDDVKMMVQAIRFVLKMVETPEFKRVEAILNPNPVPGCETLQKGSDNYWECAIRTLATTGNDQYGSCKMGPADDTEAVVDNKLRLHGINNLRVVDASIIPGTLSGRLIAATIMIAERAGDFIKKAYK